MKRLYWWYYYQKHRVHHPEEVRHWNWITTPEFRSWHSKVMTYLVSKDLRFAAEHHDTNPERIRQLIAKYVRQCKAKNPPKLAVRVDFWKIYEDPKLGIGYMSECGYLTLYFWFFMIDISIRRNKK